MVASRLAARLLPRVLIASLAALLLLCCTSGIALAHARLVRSNPPPDALLRTAPTHIDLWFSEDLNGAASRIIVWDRHRHPVTSGGASLVGPREMQIGLKPLRPGSYLVLWTSVSSQDGHVLHGSYLFSVKVRGPGPSLVGVSTGTEQSFPDAVGLLALIGHWIELLVAVTWAGAAFFSAIILSPLAVKLGLERVTSEYRRTRTLMWLSLLLLLAASTAVLLTDAYGIAGNDWSSVLSHSTLLALFADQYGQVWVARQVLVLIALAFTLRYRARGITIPLRSEAVGAQTIFAALYLYALAASGHAASAGIGVLPGHHGNLFSVSIAADWLHLLVDAVWFGGQIYIALVLIPVLLLRREGTHRPLFLTTLDRFTPAAYASIAGYMISGLFAAKVLIPSWYAFFYSIYGRALIVKMSLIGLMMLTSAFTVYLVRPRLRRVLAGKEGDEPEHRLMRRLLAWLRINPVLGAGVLLATSVMFYYPVPVGFGPPGPSVYVAHGSGLSVALSIKPDHSGPNEITVVLHDRQGRPVQQAHVTVLTTMLDMVMGTGVGSLTERSPGRFVGSTDLGMGGRWRLQVLVYQPSGLTRISIDVRVAT